MHENLLESGVKIERHYATDEEHEAAKASLLAREREQSNPQDIHTRSEVDTTADVLADTELNTTADINGDSSIGKRDPSLLCYDNPDGAFCYHCSRETA